MIAGWLAQNATVLPQILAGTALVGVGAWLLVLDRRAAATRLLAAVLLSYGVAIVLDHVRVEDPALEDALTAAALVGIVHTTTAVALLALVFPRPLARGLDAPAAALLPAAAAVLGAASVVAHDRLFPGTSPLGWTRAYEALASSAGGLVLAVRLTREPPGAERRSLFLLVVATSLLAFHFRTLNLALGLASGGNYDSGPADGVIFLAQVASLLLLSAGAAALGRAALGADAERARFSRAALAVVPLAVGTGAASALDPSGAWLDLTSGLWRASFALLVTWGVLRHHFLGLDVKVRWTVSRSTLAAVFIAVFFVVSEGAQQFFGDTLGSAYLGIAAAGALVFAISPLARLADRVAERAVPVASAPPGLPARAEDTYRRALRLALRGARPGREDEVTLARLAEDLGIGAGRAVEIRHEVEAEAAEAPDPGPGRAT